MTETKITSKELRDSYLEYLPDLCSQIVEDIKKVARNGPYNNMYIKDIFDIQDKIVVEKLIELLKERFSDDIDIVYCNKFLLRNKNLDSRNYYSITIHW